MTENQFNQLIQELHLSTRAILAKMEEIRCGLIDIETNIELDTTGPYCVGKMYKTHGNKPSNKTN